MSEPLVGGYGEPGSWSAERSAVLVVDLTNDFGHPDGAYPRNGAPCGPLVDVLAPVAELIGAAREGGRPVILCSQIVLTDANDTVIGSPGLLAARPFIREGGLRSNTWGTRMLDELPEPDLVVEKVRASASSRRRSTSCCASSAWTP